MPRKMREYILRWFKSLTWRNPRKRPMNECDEIQLRDLHASCAIETWSLEGNRGSQKARKAKVHQICLLFPWSQSWLK